MVNPQTLDLSIVGAGPAGLGGLLLLRNRRSALAGVTKGEREMVVIRRSEGLQGGMGKMVEKEKICPVCGKKGNFKGFACDPCQDKIRREALGERKKIKENADKEIRKYGGKGD